MTLTLFLLLMAIGNNQGTPFFGTVMTFDPKTINNGNITVRLILDMLLEIQQMNSVVKHLAIFSP